MTVKDDLRAAKALIDMPDTWDKPHRHGSFLDNSYSTADVLAIGLKLYIHGPRYQKALDALLAASGFTCLKGMAAWEQLTDITHADIMALFDRAITAAEAGE